MQIPQKRVTKLICHHKVAALPPQPRLRPLLKNKNLELPR
jgi:hypothetical protein